MTMRPTRVMIGLITLVAAYYAASAAAALSFAPVNPVVASKMPIANGSALARVARARLARDMQAQAKRSGQEAGQAELPTSIDKVSHGQALQAFRQEPLESSAVTLLALGEVARDQNKARSMFRGLHRLTKRDELAALWLAQDAAKRSDIAGTLTYFDEVLRTSNEARPLLLRNFAAATSVPGFRDAMAKLIAARPPWVEEFWIQGAEVPTAATALAELELKLAKSGVSTVKSADQKIANNLVGQGRFALARQLYDSAAPKPDRTIVRNPDFLVPSYMPPVDWETYSTGEIGSEISVQDGVLAAYASKAPGGVVARQWITLPAGFYRLRASSRIFGRSDGDSTALLLTCLEQGPRSSAIVFELNDGQTERDFQAPHGCSNYWLDVRVSPGDRSTGIDVEFDQISIAPAGN